MHQLGKILTTPTPAKTHASENHCPAHKASQNFCRLQLTHAAHKSLEFKINNTSQLSTSFWFFFQLQNQAGTTQNVLQDKLTIMAFSDFL